MPLLVSLIMLPILTPYLVRADYGVWGMIMVYVSSFAPFRELGMNTLYQNSFFQHNTKFEWFWNRYFAFNMITSAIYGLLLLGFLPLILYKHIGSKTLMVVLMTTLPIIFFENTRSVAFKILQYKQKMYLVSIITGFNAVVMAGLNFYTVKFLHWGYMGWVTSSFVVSLITFCYFFYILHIRYAIRPNFNFSIAWIKRKLKIGLPTISHSYASLVLRSFDRFLLDTLGTPIGTIGVYNVSYAFGSYIESLQLSVNYVTTPIYLRLMADNIQTSDKKIRTLSYIWYFTILYFCVLFGFWMKEIISILYRNPDFSEVHLYAIPIIMAYSYMPLYSASIQKIIFFEKTKNVLLISAIAAAINIVGNLALIPFWGIKAAAFTTFISYLYMGAAGFYIKKISKNITVSYYPLLYLCSTVAITVLLLLVQDLPIMIKMAVTSTMIVVTLILLKIYFPKLQSIKNNL